MLQETTGTLVLEMVPSPDAEQKVLQFLAQYAKKVPASKMKDLIRKTPLILGRNIPMERAQSIVSGLQEIGATASYLPAALDVKENGYEKRVVTETLQESAHERTITEIAPDAPNPTARRGDDLAHRLAATISEVNKEVWLILSMFAIIAAMNYLVVSHRVLLGLYTLPTIFSAYFYGRRHATLTAFFSVLLVGMLMHFNPALLQKAQGSTLVDSRWYEILAWGSILIVTAYAMGTLYDKSSAQLSELRQTYRGLLVILRHFIANDKYDGSGYHPTVAEEIPLEARILAVADVYDSLVSDRPYRKAVSPFEAKEIIEKGSGTDFDPKVVQAFLKAFRRREMEVPELVV